MSKSNYNIYLYISKARCLTDQTRLSFELLNWFIFDLNWRINTEWTWDLLLWAVWLQIGLDFEKWIILIWYNSIWFLFYWDEERIVYLSDKIIIQKYTSRTSQKSILGCVGHFSLDVCMQGLFGYSLVLEFRL